MTLVRLRHAVLTGGSSLGWTVGVTSAGERLDERQHTEHGLERKQQLLEAAAELFAARGYSATRIADMKRRGFGMLSMWSRIARVLLSWAR